MRTPWTTQARGVGGRPGGPTRVASTSSAWDSPTQRTTSRGVARVTAARRSEEMRELEGSGGHGASRAAAAVPGRYGSEQADRAFAGSVSAFDIARRAGVPRRGIERAGWALRAEVRRVLASWPAGGSRCWSLVYDERPSKMRAARIGSYDAVGHRAAGAAPCWRPASEPTMPICMRHFARFERGARDGAADYSGIAAGALKRPGTDFALASDARGARLFSLRGFARVGDSAMSNSQAQRS